MTRPERDELIRRALTPPADVVAPDGLGDEIYRAIGSTPQRGRPVLTTLARGPVFQGAWLLIVITLLLAALAISIIGRPQPTPISVEGYHGGPGRTGVMVGPGPAGEVDIGWRVQHRGPLPFTLMPIAVEDRIYVADAAGDVSAINAVDGSAFWTTILDTPVTGSPVLAGGLVVAGTESGEVVALDAGSGLEEWRYRIGSPIHASLVTFEGMIIAIADDGRMAALAAETGEERWTMQLPGNPSRGAAIDDGTMYIGASDDLLAIDLATRTVRWRFEVGPGIIATPAAVDGAVYVAGGIDAQALHAVFALDAVTGEERWRFETESGGQVLVGAVADESVFVLADDGVVYRLAASDGSEQWRFPTNGAIASLASVAAGVLYVSSTDRSVYAIDMFTGAELWRFEVRGEPTSPLVIGGRVLVGTNLGEFIALVGSLPAQ